MAAPFIVSYPHRHRSVHFAYLMAFILLFTTLGFAQEDQKSTKGSGKKGSTQSSTPLNVDDVIKMAKAGFSDETIILQIKKRGAPFTLSTDQLIQLKSASVSEHVIQTMIDPSRAEIKPTDARAPIANQPISVGATSRTMAVTDSNALRGVVVQDLTLSQRQQRYKAFWAVAITSVQPGTPAEAAGIKPGDIIPSVIIAGERRPARTGTPVEFAQAAKRCVSACLVEIFRENENNNGFVEVGAPEIAFLSVYSSSSRALVAYRDSRLQTLYKVWSRFNALSDDDMLALASEPAGLVTGTTNGDKQRTAPIAIKYRPATPANPKPWSVTKGFQEDGAEKKLEIVDENAEAAALESVPKTSALWGIKVKVVKSPPAIAPVQSGPPSPDLRNTVIESASELTGRDLRIGDSIRAIYVAGSQPYVKTQDDSSPQSSLEFYRLAALCIPDCIARVMHPQENQEIMLWLRSVPDAGLSASNFLPSLKPGQLTFVDVRSRLSYETVTGGGVIYRDADTGKLLGAVVLDKEIALQLAQQMKSQGASTSARQNGHPTLTAEQITAAIHQGSTQPGQSQGLALADTGSQFAQNMAALNSSMGNKKPWDQASASGFQISIFTPQSWVAQQASDAAQQGRKFTAADVTDEMLRPIIRIIALPSTPPPAGSGLNFGQDVSSVGDIRLADSARKNPIEPANRKPFKYQNLSGLIAEFSLDDLARVRQKDGEFYVLVSGPRNSHEFKIKKKHLASIPL